MSNEIRPKYGQPLSRREREVQTYVCLGWNNKEIATKLQVSHRTIEDHRAHVYIKAGVRNAVELVRKVYGIKEFGPSNYEAAE